MNIGMISAGSASQAAFGKSPHGVVKKKPKTVNSKATRQKEADQRAAAEAVLRRSRDFRQ